MPYSRFTIKWEKVVELRDEELSYAKYGRRRHYHNQSFQFHFEDNLKEYNDAVFSNGKDNKAFNLDVYKAIEKIDADVIYLDPPYAGTMNDYFGFYGLLMLILKGRRLNLLIIILLTKILLLNSSITYSVNLENTNTGCSVITVVQNLQKKNFFSCYQNTPIMLKCMKCLTHIE